MVITRVNLGQILLSYRSYRFHHLECGGVACVEDLPLHLVGCDEELLQARIIEKLSRHQVYRALSETLNTMVNIIIAWVSER